MKKRLVVLVKGKSRPIGYVSPGGFVKTAKGWRKKGASDMAAAAPKASTPTVSKEQVLASAAKELASARRQYERATNHKAKMEALKRYQKAATAHRIAESNVKTATRKEQQKKAYGGSTPDDVASQIKDAIAELGVKKAQGIDDGYGGIKYHDYPEETAKRTGKKGEFTVLFETPRTMRHPEEYEEDFGQPYKFTAREVELDKEDRKLWRVIDAMKKKFPQYAYSMAGDTNYGRMI